MPLQWRQLPPNRFRPRRRIHTGRKKKYKPSPPHIQLVQYKLLKMCKRPGYLIHPRYGRVLKKPIHEWTSDDVAFFRPFVNRFGKILPRVKTILSVKQHRIVSNLIRRARYEKKIPFRISKMKKVGRYPIRRDMKSLRLYNKRRMILSKALADGRITSTES